MFVKYVATYVFNCHKTTFLQMATSLAYIQYIVKCIRNLGTGNYKFNHLFPNQRTIFKPETSPLILNILHYPYTCTDIAILSAIISHF